MATLFFHRKQRLCNHFAVYLQTTHFTVLLLRTHFIFYYSIEKQRMGEKCHKHFLMQFQFILSRGILLAEKNNRSLQADGSLQFMVHSPPNVTIIA
jgi:hypothetical protein